MFFSSFLFLLFFASSCFCADLCCGPLEDASCDVEQVEQANIAQLQPILADLIDTPFFSLFHVPADGECTLLKRDGATSDADNSAAQADVGECSGEREQTRRAAALSTSRRSHGVLSRWQWSSGRSIVRRRRRCWRFRRLRWRVGRRRGERATVQRQSGRDRKSKRVQGAQLLVRVVACRDVAPSVDVSCCVSLTTRCRVICSTEACR